MNEAEIHAHWRWICEVCPNDVVNITPPETWVTLAREVKAGQMVTLDDIAPRRFYPDADQEGAE